MGKMLGATLGAEIYRDVLALRIRSIGVGAELTVEENRRGTKFATFRPWSDSPKPSAVAAAIRFAAGLAAELGEG
jgi:hypothetical protein